MLLSCKSAHCLWKPTNFLTFLSVNPNIYDHHVARMTNIELHSLAVLMTQTTDIILPKKRGKRLIISDELEV